MSQDRLRKTVARCDWWPTYKGGQLHRFYCNCFVQRKTTWQCTDSLISFGLTNTNNKHLEFGKWKSVRIHTVNTGATKYFLRDN
jgi:hypothetical protein